MLIGHMQKLLKIVQIIKFKLEAFRFSMNRNCPMLSLLFSWGFHFLSALRANKCDEMSTPKKLTSLVYKYYNSTRWTQMQQLWYFSKKQSKPVT